MKSYMIIPVYDIVVLPDVDYQLGTADFSEEEKSRIKIDGNKAIFLPLKKPVDRSEVTADDFYPYGVLADILDITETKIGTRVHARTHQKVEICDFSAEGPIPEASYVTHEEISDITAKGEKELLDSLKKTTIEITQHIQGADLAINYIRECSSINEYGALFCQFFDMDAEEKELFLSDLNLNESGLARIIKTGYSLLGLISFLTAGPQEVRAWTITKGTKAPQAAGKIHTDFEKGFIRAEVVSFDDLVKCGGMTGAKEKGLVRLEGKEYVMQDGDVVLFRFNV